MLKTTSLLSLSLLVACSGDKDAGSDTGDSAGGDFTPVKIVATYVDGLSGAALMGGEVCLEEPELPEFGCGTTDVYGMLSWTWEKPQETNFLMRFTLDGYIDTLFTGRYNDDLAAVWAPEIEEKGQIELIYSTFQKTAVEMVLATGDVSIESGKAMAFVNLVDVDGWGIENAVVTLTDESGADAGVAHYLNTSGSRLDGTRSSTSGSGAVAIPNVEPGEYTLTVSVPNMDCLPWFSWNSDEANTVQVPVQADAVTRTGLYCVSN